MRPRTWEFLWFVESLTRIPRFHDSEAAASHRHAICFSAGREVFVTSRHDDERGRLTDALEVLERSLEAPVVPGETELRAEAVRVAVEETRDAFVACTRYEHQRAFREIGDADPGLLHRVDRMKQEDAVLVGCWERAATDARELTHAAAVRPGDEASFRESFARYVTEVLDLVLTTRSQQAAVRTWVSEAFQRDRGEGD
jgi:hypothetical protein